MIDRLNLITRLAAIENELIRGLEIRLLQDPLISKIKDSIAKLHIKMQKAAPAKVPYHGESQGKRSAISMSSVNRLIQLIFDIYIVILRFTF